ncbi:alpha/beta hydrolase fold domain-containing protein [Lactobacillus sp. ESL0791]|uniref:alpha/beta hydrolase fold domain-containing protein n=1 Tax=Lactobacillus sp. ESL0791 TaxID=2983234 RepID=UPI0023F67A8E|nr:alpha/beta hydrolase fold domain-containing protein [Lactobacillus sp. ESL0791]MDF7639263.1 alpha/beta hydrolase fold domain-containing protein [Lactobacillus sp. ESL0791]
MKKYAASLVSKLHEQTEVVEQDGVQLLCKPVPDTDERDVLDSRVREVIVKKRAVKNPSSDFSLFHTRNRPDKVNYDISHEEIDEQETLVEITDDHYIDVFIFKAEDYIPDKPLIIYVHGGGFTAGNISLYRNEMRYLAEVTKGIIVFPEYRLAPENPYPAPVDDCLDVLKWTKNNCRKLGAANDRIVMIGDSAGGNLINSCLVKNDYRDIDLIIELYPVIDNQISKLEIADNFKIAAVDRDAVLARLNKMKHSQDINYYLLDKISAADPLVNLDQIADFTRIPQMTIISSQFDLLKIGSDKFIRDAKKNGKEIKSIRYLGCDHGFFDLIGIAPQAEEVCLEIADEINQL